MATVTMASFECPRGEMVTKPWGVQLHPSDWMIYRNRGRVPLHTRHTLGAREAERDQRRRQDAAAATITFEPPTLYTGRCESCGSQRDDLRLHEGILGCPTIGDCDRAQHMSWLDADIQAGINAEMCS